MLSKSSCGHANLILGSMTDTAGRPELVSVWGANTTPPREPEDDGWGVGWLGQSGQLGPVVLGQLFSFCFVLFTVSSFYFITFLS